MTDFIELWKRSHWLSNSAKAYATHFFKDEWQAAVEHRGDQPWMEILQESSNEARAAGKTGWDIAEQLLGEFVVKTKPQADLLKRAEQQITDYLLDGTYRGYGFDRPRTLDTEPVRIPAECWKGPVSWVGNEVSYQSLTFSQVRVRMMREHLDPILKKPFDTPVPKAGRPTVAPAIEAAFHALHKIGEIDLSASQMSHYPKVRKWLEKNGTNLPVPADKISSETIRRIISPLFKELKEIKKQ
ncbi:hypothetical protein [Ruegeria halocynthiae]|uniref:hypothetical protein n=1 Tax=Ruegeria halocynthiae TaxID=985054 RepID=UPI00056726C9|nr:hypothetical protein [Ruegeria halocynthiae]